MELDVWYDLRNPQQWRRDPATLYAETLEQIAWADTLGFGAVWLSEHHFTDEGYLPGLMPMLGAVAMRTTRMRIGTAVLLAPLYHPLRLAEEAAVVDALSGGRLDLGLAPGYRLAEFATMGVPKAERGTRTDEIIELLIAAWTTPRVSYRGRHFQFDDVAVAPKPVQQPHPPLWIGGSTPAAARRAARFGANFMPDSGAPLEVFQQYRDECAAAGRPPGEVADQPRRSRLRRPGAGLARRQGALLLRAPGVPAVVRRGRRPHPGRRLGARSRRFATRRLRGRHTGHGHRRDRTTT